jgi:hypothetical protein
LADNGVALPRDTVADNGSPLPALSVVLPIPVRFALVRRTLRHLGAQTIGERVELLMVMPRGPAADVDRGELAGFVDARVVEIEDGATITACRCGNPGPLSWADIFLSFGSWVAPLDGGEMTRLPWHNTSYRRDLLLACGDRLAYVLDVMLPRSIPHVIVGLAAHSMGEMAGYALGVGDAGVQKSLKEFDRARFVRASDVEALAP